MSKTDYLLGVFEARARSLQTVSGANVNSGNFADGIFEFIFFLAVKLL
jgi:hypothetical protein